MWRLLIIFFGFLLISACNNEPEVKKDTEFVPVYGDYLFKFHRDMPGQVPYANDLVYYHLRHRDGTRVTYTSRLGGQYLKYMMTPVPQLSLIHISEPTRPY